jgi:hypothetical protein
VRELRLVTVTSDGSSLVLANDRGEQYRLPITETLRAAARGDRTRLGQLEIALESQLTPKEIQNRIRHGESADDVARAAGVPVERIRRFEGPVLAERAHVAERARVGALRRGEPGGGPAPLLGDAVVARLAGRDVDPDTLEWDAWRREDGRWTVELRYGSGGSDERARFTYDTTARASVAADDRARELVGEDRRPAEAPPRSRDWCRSTTAREPSATTTPVRAQQRLPRDPPETAAETAPGHRGVDGFVHGSSMAGWGTSGSPDGACGCRRARRGGAAGPARRAARSRGRSARRRSRRSPELGRVVLRAPARLISARPTAAPGRQAAGRLDRPPGQSPRATSARIRLERPGAAPVRDRDGSRPPSSTTTRRTARRRLRRGPSASTSCAAVTPGAAVGADRTGPVRAHRGESAPQLGR